MDKDVLEELRTLRAERDIIAIAVANAALEYFESMTSDEREIHLHNIGSIIKSYREAKKAYYDWIYSISDRKEAEQ